MWVSRKLKYIAFDESIILINKKTQCILIMLKKIHTVKILNPIPTWFAYRWAVRFFPDSEVNSVPSWIMGEIMIPLVTWNLRVSARACGSVLSWSRTLCGSLEKAASVGAKIVKGVAWRQKYIEWSFTLSIHVCVYILIVFTVLCKKSSRKYFF